MSASTKWEDRIYRFFKPGYGTVLGLLLFSLNDGGEARVMKPVVTFDAELSDSSVNIWGQAKQTATCDVSVSISHELNGAWVRGELGCSGVTVDNVKRIVCSRESSSYRSLRLESGVVFSCN